LGIDTGIDRGGWGQGLGEEKLCGGDALLCCLRFSALKGLMAQLVLLVIDGGQSW
jgi:hypothetical protein